MRLYEYVIRVRDQGSQKVRETARHFGTARNNAAQFKHEMQGVEKQGSTLSATLGKLGIAVGAAFAVRKVIDFAKASFNAASEFEQAQTSFEVMLGSAEKAVDMLTNIDNFANATPFTNNVLMENAKLLLNFGVAGEKILPTLQMLGDVSGGNTQKMNGLTLAFAQMTSTGRLMGQDLLQMINAGFNPLQQISEKTGKSMAVLKDEMSKGQISAKMVEDAFKDATSEGGKFYKMMEKQSQTAAGKMSTAIGKAGLALRKIGQEFLPLVSTALDGFINLMDKFNGKSQTQSELLDQQRIRFNNLMGALRSGELTQKQRAKTIDELNSKYKDYLPKLIDEKTSLTELARIQKDVNKAMLQKVHIMAREETLLVKMKQLAERQTRLDQLEETERELAIIKANLAPGRQLTGDNVRRAKNTKLALADVRGQISGIEKEIQKENERYDRIFKKFGITGDEKTEAAGADNDGDLAQEFDEQKEKVRTGLESISAGAGPVNISFGDVRFAEEIMLNVANVDEGLEELRDKFNQWFATILNGGVQAARSASGN